MNAKQKLAETTRKIKARIKESEDERSENAPWVKQVAMLTGILAAMAGFLDVRSTTITNQAIYESNQAILAQTQASDQWSEYQADSIKARIVETALVGDKLQPADRTKLTGDDKDLRDRQTSIKDSAAAKEAERDQHLKNGARNLSAKDLLGYAGLAAQLGIALASVAALVRWRLPFMAGIAMGLLGALIAGYTLASQYGIVP